MDPLIQFIVAELRYLQEKVDKQDGGDYQRGYLDAVSNILSLIEEKAWEEGVQLDD